MKTSAMPEHLAGSVAMLVNISEYFNSANSLYRELTLDCYQHLIDSMAEIWPLSTILDFEFCDCVETLIKLLNAPETNSMKSRFAALLLKTKYQFETFYNNDEYKFNEDKRTIQALENILELLQEGGDAFWNNCISYLNQELESNNENRIIFTLETIELLNLQEFVPKIKDMLCQEYSENIIYKLVLTLDCFKDFDGVEKERILNEIQDFNLKMVVQQALA